MTGSAAAAAAAALLELCCARSTALLKPFSLPRGGMTPWAPGPLPPPYPATGMQARTQPAQQQARRLSSSASTIQTDCVVIGAGVVGLACARAMAMAGHEVVVLEKEGAIGTGTSSRNSEVIHAGIYYPPGSAQALMCVQGRDMLYEYCRELNVPHRRIGKWIVATSPEQVPKLLAIQSRGAANGVHDLHLLSGAEARSLEPQLHCHAALASPSTGILDSHALMACLQADVERLGGLLVLGSRVLGGSSGGGAGGGRLQLAVQEAGSGERQLLEARHVINSAGLDAPQLASSIAGFPASALPAAHLAKGNYFSLSVPRSPSSPTTPATPTSGPPGSSRGPFQRLVYPIPEPGGLGIHYTLDMAGNAKFGPDVEWVDRVDYQVDPGRAAHFYRSIRQYYPGLRDGALQPSYCGIRPKISGRGQPDADFLIQGQDKHGVPGLVNLFGIGSPGLTSSLAIAAHVAGMLRQQ